MQKEKECSRREFISRGTTAAAGLAAISVLGSSGLSKAAVQKSVQSRVIGANDRVNVAVIGFRGQGETHYERLSTVPNVRIKTLCDIDENLFPERVKAVEKLQGVAPGTEWDMLKVFDDKDIDAITTATPNHWHALTAIWACQAGKHVYVEKPCCHEIWEGRKMVEAARKYNRVMQVGFQNRSFKNVRAAMKFLHDGGIGDVYMARGLCFKARDPFPPAADCDPPAGVHYDRWLGPAPKRPFNPNRFHYKWHWNWDYGNGDIGNQGPHQFDIARWGLNKNEHPVKIFSEGDCYAFGDCPQQTANTQVATFKYADNKMLVFEVRGLYTNHESYEIDTGKRKEGILVGNLFYGSKGWMHLDGSNWKTFFGRKNEPGPTSEAGGEISDPTVLRGTGGSGIYENFINAVRSGNPKDLTSDIESGFMSSALPHMANISYRLGRVVHFDGKNEKFVDDKQANAMLKRDYRKPYIVPDKV
jgi:predicted dehydrogenase